MCIYIYIQHHSYSYQNVNKMYPFSHSQVIKLKNESDNIRSLDVKINNISRHDKIVKN